MRTDRNLALTGRPCNRVNWENAGTSVEEIFLDYVAWCATSHHVPLRDGVFRERFADLARSAGIPATGEWADRVYLDVALGKP